MQFQSDEYLLLSRRGSVPSPIRAGPPRGPGRPPPIRSLRLRLHGAGQARVSAARALRGGLQATWTAFGPGSTDL